MPRPQALPLCNCLARTAQALNRFLTFSTRSSEPFYIPLDEVLILGESFIDHWELLYGCPVADAHLDARTLEMMIDAAIKMLTLFEAAVSSMIGGWRGTQPHGGGVGI
ncbi:Transcription factor [Penicillium digitatum]|uniref:Transcription factor n=1 Tax=Penicillium digitatum TaxID=36651 RepID=A0A7T7BHS1_PENDI|nr:hypothetical protein PDIDSM_9105 [Penicillium digitatum]QQK40146.1 Transcription factor [Penicillium digitatum]